MGEMKLSKKEKEELIVQLYAQGYNRKSIAQEVGVARGTLNKILTKYESEIEAVRLEHVRQIQDKYIVSKNKRIENLGESLLKIDDEISTRELSEMSLKDLLHHKLQLVKTLKAEEVVTDAAPKLSASDINPTTILELHLSLMQQTASGAMPLWRTEQIGEQLKNLSEYYERFVTSKEIDELEEQINSEEELPLWLTTPSEESSD